VPVPEFSPRGFVRVLQIDAKVAMNPGVAMDAKPKAFLGDIVVNAVPEFHNIFLKGFVARWVVKYLTDDSGVSGTQNIVL
jgi:hypothetical protein